MSALYDCSVGFGKKVTKKPFFKPSISGIFRENQNFHFNSQKIKLNLLEIKSKLVPIFFQTITYRMVPICLYLVTLFPCVNCQRKSVVQALSQSQHVLFLKSSSQLELLHLKPSPRHELAQPTAKSMCLGKSWRFQNLQL